jgi:outer membrane autotransporter protein
MPRLPYRFAAPCALTLLAAGAARAQVISTQAVAPLGAADFLAGARMQFGLAPAAYQGAVVAGQLTQSTTADVLAAGGVATGTNPPFWNNNPAQGNRFTLTYNAAAQTLQLRVLRPGPGGIFVQQFTITEDALTLAGAGAMNISFGALNASTFGNIRVTSGGQTIALGPGGNWSGTALAQSTLTGWNLGADWELLGDVFFNAPGQDTLPQVQVDVLAPGLGYQLSDRGAGTPQVINYGRFQDMVVVDADFDQAQFGGTDGVVEADILSRAAVTFDIAGSVDLAGGVFDLNAGTTSLVAPAQFGDASVVKRGAGTLRLSGASAYSGSLTIEDGTVVLANALGIGAGGLSFGTVAPGASSTLSLEVDPVFGAALPVEVLGTSDAVIEAAAGSALDLEIASTLTSAAGSSLTLRGLGVEFTGDATGLLGELAVDASTFTMSGPRIGGDVLVTGSSIFDASGRIDGDLTSVGSVILASGGDASLPGTLQVDGSLALDAGSTLAANVFLNDVAPGVRASDTVNVLGPSATFGGALVAAIDRDVSPGAIAPAPGQTREWRLVSAAGGGGTGTFTSAELRLIDPTAGTTVVLPLVVNGSVDSARVRYTTTVDADGARIVLLGLAALPPDQLVQTACGTVTGAVINDLVDELQLIQAIGTPDASAVADAILLLDDAEIPPAYAATQQKNPYADPDVILDANAMAGRTAMLRLMQLREGRAGEVAARTGEAAGGQAPQASAGGDPFGAPLNGPTPDEGNRAWLRGYGFYEDVDGEDCATCGYQAAIGGAMVGVDFATDGGGIVGAFAGVGPGSISFDGPNGGQQENIVNALVGLYGSIVPGDGGAYLQGFVLGSYNGISRTRTIDVPGLATRAAESDNAAWTLSVGGELGLNVDLGEHTTLQPFAGVSWGQYWGEGYAETGAESLDLTVGSQSANEWQPTAGARIMHASRSGSDIVTPFVGAAFLGQIPVGDGWAPVYTSDFNLNEATQVATAPIDRYGVNVQLGIELASIKGMTAFIAFDGAWLTGKQRYGGQVGVFVPF